MCRCPDYNGISPYAPTWRPAGTARGSEDEGGLRIRSFQLRLSVSVSSSEPPVLPGTIVLVYFPRAGGRAQGLEINGCKTRPGVPAFLSLYRVQSAQRGTAVFACTDRVWTAAEGARFEAYVGEEEAVKGVLRRREEKGDWGAEGGWEMECRCGAVGGACSGVCGMEVTLVGESGVVLREEVEVPIAKGRSRRRGRGGRRRFCSRLEGIPEVESESEDGEADSSETESCSCCGSWEGWEMISGSEGSSEAEEYVEAEIEGVRWAVDVGIWVMCIGVGLLVSKASSVSSLNRRWGPKGFLFR